MLAFSAKKKIKLKFSMSQDISRSANRLLATLPQSEYLRLEPYLTRVSLPAGTVFYEASETIKTVYFPNTALISLVSVLKDGLSTEIALVGGTGMVGLSVILGSSISPNRAIVQVADSAIKISAIALKQEFDRGGALQQILLTYIATRLNETAQLAVCNRHHTIEERLARWLLIVRDLTQSNRLPLTQEFISNMLGVNRSGVTIAAGILQQAGIIRYSRGIITIIDTQALENVACECYQLYHDNFYRS